MRYMIIGAGPAALAAAATLRRVDPAGSVKILTKEQVPPYARLALPYLLAGRIEEKGISLPVPAGAELLPGEEVVAVRPGRREVKTASGRVFSYDRLLIATGARPERPKVEGADQPFVFTVRDLSDIAGIRLVLKGNRGRAVVAGAGPVGLEMGDALRQLGMEVTFVVASERIFSQMLDAPAAAWLAERIRRQGVEIVTGEEIASLGKGGEVALRSGRCLKADLVVFGKGVRPAASFLSGSGIALEEGIVVNERQQTNIPEIFAAGDVAQGREIVSGRRRVTAVWPVAVEQGRVAGLNMAGRDAFYGGALSRNILRVFDTSLFAAGAGRSQEGYEVRTAIGTDFYRKLVLKDGVLKGIVVAGEVKNEGFYTNLIVKEIDCSARADSLLRGGYAYGRHLAGLRRLC